MAQPSRQSGSPTIQRNFGKLNSTREFRVSTVSADGVYGGPFAPSTAATFSAAGAYDKVLTLALVTMATGIGAYILHLPIGITILAALAGAALYLGTAFLRPTAAFVTAPLYAVAQGVFLGSLSYWAALQGFGAVALAVLGTAGIYFGVLTLYRTGMVRVTSSFVRIAIVIGFGTIFAAFGSVLFSHFNIPLLSATLGSNAGIFLIFGVMYLVSGIMNLFIDFAYIDRASASGQLNRRGEWFASMLVLGSLVIIFLGLLRILGAFGGGGRR